MWTNKTLNRIILLIILVSSSATVLLSYPDYFLRANVLTNLASGFATQGASREGGAIAPNFCLTDLEGSEFCLEDFRGKVVVIDLMATWCLACEDQVAYLRKANEVYKDVVFITVDIDLTETTAELKGFKEYTGANWRFAVDTLTARVGLRYESKYLPTLYIIDREGFIVWSEKGLTDSDTLIGVLNKYV